MDPPTKTISTADEKKEFDAIAKLPEDKKNALKFTIAEKFTKGITNILLNMTGLKFLEGPIDWIDMHPGTALTYLEYAGIAWLVAVGIALIGGLTFLCVELGTNFIDFHSLMQKIMAFL